MWCLIHEHMFISDTDLFKTFHVVNGNRFEQICVTVQISYICRVGLFEKNFPQKNGNKFYPGSIINKHVNH